MILALIFALAQAPEVTGLSLLRMCNGEPGSPAHAGCSLYLLGFRDAMMASADAQRQIGRPLACLPPLLTTEDMRAAYREKVRGNASRLRAPMNAALVGVLVEAYPCR